MGSGKRISLVFQDRDQQEAGGVDILMATASSYGVTIRNCGGKVIAESSNPNSNQPKVWSFWKDLDRWTLKIIRHDKNGAELFSFEELDDCDQDIWKRKVKSVIVKEADTATDRYRALGNNKININQVNEPYIYDSAEHFW